MNDNPAKAAAQTIARKLIAAGHETYFAGGCVRDSLLGKTPKDYDIATSARPDVVASLMDNANLVGAHFGVVITKEADYTMEIATFRTDGSYSDGRRPDSVEFASSAEDAQRRDFTINGLFEHPETGEIIDHVGGKADLENRTLRAIGDPHARFQEDSLRLMRAIRFASRLNLHIHKDTMAAIVEMAPRLQMIATERTREEFSRILSHENRLRGMMLLQKSGLIDQFLPEFALLKPCDQSPDHHPEGDVEIHTLMMVEAIPPKAELELVLATLLHDIGKPATQNKLPCGKITFHGHEDVGAEMTKTILTRMKYPSQTIDAVTALVADHMKPHHAHEMRKATVRRLLGRKDIDNLLELHRADCACSNKNLSTHELLVNWRVELEKEPAVPPPLVTGKDLIRHGLTPGPIFRQILHDAQTEQLEGRLNTVEDGEKWLKGALKNLEQPEM